jgi:hypothetical protein
MTSIKFNFGYMWVAFFLFHLTYRLRMLTISGRSKVGKIKMEKDKHGNVTFPLCAGEEDLESTASESEEVDNDDMEWVTNTTISNIQHFSKKVSKPNRRGSRH